MLSCLEEQMPAAPFAAPPCETAGSLRSSNGVHQEHLVVPKQRFSRWVTSSRRRRRRSRSRSRDSPTVERQRRLSRRERVLAGLLLATALSVAVLNSFRYRQPRDVQDPTTSVIVRNGDEDEEARLRKEVLGLETTLLSRKVLLGIAPGLPLESRRPADGGRGHAVHGSGGDRLANNYAKPLDLGHQQQAQRPAPSPRDGQQQQQQQQRHQHQQDQPPSIPPGSLAGEAMFGGVKPPLRPSLESQPGLIREPVPLIVGGSDGSGTRGVVALLQRLKVPMVVEDRGTMDVHGAPYMVKGGWPAVVRPVIGWAKETGYESRGAPAQLRRKTFDALGGLKVQMQKMAGESRPTGGEAAKHVSWGFKAPVSMVLVPFFEEAWGKAKFLHVVRDGRDIAFSGNQTPVEKFYADMFPEGTRESGFEEPSVKAMALWNSWNVGVHHWAASRKERGATGLDYLLLHAEDLIDPEAKFAAIKDVAEFVGSPLSDFELCCIATEGSKDMGSHTKSQKDRGKITSRFGKWKNKVEGKPELSKQLHDEGERGLRTFGYEPERSLRASSGFQCAAEQDPTCPKPASSPQPSRSSRPKNLRAQAQVPAPKAPVPAAVEDTATCVGLKLNMDFNGFDSKAVHAQDHLGCCQECHQADGCSHFTFDYSSGVCYLKVGQGVQNFKVGLVSGMAPVP